MHVTAEIDKIQSLLENENLTNAQKSDMCLESAMGSLTSIKYHTHRLIQIASSKSHKLSSNENKIQEKSVCDYFSHPVFTSKCLEAKNSTPIGIS